jgi:predicted GTPase
VKHVLSKNTNQTKEGDEQQKKQKPVIVVVNKCDNDERIESIPELSYVFQIQ